MSNIYQPEELATLNNNKAMRERMIQSITKDGIPVKTNELRVLKEILDSSDESIHKSVNNRLKHQDNQNKEAILDTVAMVLKNAAKAISVDNSNNRVISVDDSYIPNNIVPGEADIHPERLNPDEFISKVEI